ncbi:hypothetical protein [Trichocoleus sp. ST-U2]|uniref:hypothetical protein n=1 Tax=Trichocoleus sp. ST-U2 TaxID=2933929 RepID=UPI003296BEB6
MREFVSLFRATKRYPTFQRVWLGSSKEIQPTSFRLKSVTHTKGKNQAVTSNGSDRVWKSTIVNENLDEVFPKSLLMPSNPGERSHSSSFQDTNTPRTILCQ